MWPYDSLVRNGERERVSHLISPIYIYIHIRDCINKEFYPGSLTHFNSEQIEEVDTFREHREDTSRFQQGALFTNTWHGANMRKQRITGFRFRVNALILARGGGEQSPDL